MNAPKRKLKNLVALTPDPAYKELIDPYERIQATSVITFGRMFPVVDGCCACGCGSKLTGRQRRWANPDHYLLPYDYYRIIVYADREVVLHYLIEGDKWLCKGCDDECNIWECEADHILEVRVV